jgi:23S rRNA pseudouridine2604 synthase
MIIFICHRGFIDCISIPMFMINDVFLNRKLLGLSISINKYIASTGFCSRREAEKYIEQERVTINDHVATLLDKVFPKDIVAVDGERLNVKKKNTYIAFHKPMGVTCTTDLKDKTNIIDFINHSNRIFPIGRLDKDSTGLILLTDDGDIVNHILRVENNHEKEYVVRVNRNIDKDFVLQMSNGMIIQGEKTKKCVVKVESKNQFRIILKQGLNRQIRRMCQKLGYQVTSLSRVRIMHIHLNNLKMGKWRNLSEEEVDQLKK